MKICTFFQGGKTRTGIIRGNEVHEVPTSIIKALQNPSDNYRHIKVYDIHDLTILPPFYPSKVVCVGLNYKDHARELNMDMPEEPVLFIKPSTSIIGHLEAIVYPQSAKQVDYEAEMAVVICQEAKNVKIGDVSEYIGGFTALNDVTARDLQERDGQWTRAKSFDTFCPLGPCIETELDPSHQQISSKLNGNVKQNSNTKNMIFSAEELVEFISHIMTLNPGDIIATGTPPGVGPLQVGDVVEIFLEDVGVLKNRIIEY